ncbi:MAG: F0F1 ATP synthase subunit C [Gammaproteobacteria bacterium]|nr:F0F1 ATP synthase subunit C [Gammaproteobacteria bacterium]
MSDLSTIQALAPILASLNSQVAYAAALMIALPAMCAAFSLAFLGSKFLECISRQPEASSLLTGRFFIVAGMIDAAAIIAMGMGILAMFVNPYASAIVALAA